MSPGRYTEYSLIRKPYFFDRSFLHNLKAELFPVERSVANELLAEADAMIEDLHDQLMLVRQELTEAHETLASQYCNKGDDLSSRHAGRTVQDAQAERWNSYNHTGLLLTRLRVIPLLEIL